MATTPYQPTSWTSEAVTQAKLAQMSNNDQWLFENLPKIRYSNAGLVKETSIKMIVGKTPFPANTTRNYIYQTINFGSFFSAGCHPIVVASLEAQGGSMHRAKVVIQGNPINIGVNGFIAIVTGDTYTSIAPGWINWMAVGY